MLHELLQKIEELDESVTEGPWTSTGNDYGGKVYEPSGYPLPGCTSCGENEATYEGQDAEFIALARTSLPQLAKALRNVIGVTDTIWDHLNNPVNDEVRNIARDAIHDAITDAMEGDDE